MIFRALLDLAEREGLTADPAYEPKPVDFFIHLGPKGRYLSTVMAPRAAPARDAKGRPKGTPKPPSRMIPRRTDRTSNPQAEFLVDKAEYVFGIDPKPENKRSDADLRERRRAFRERVEGARRDLPEHQGLEAVSEFLNGQVPSEIGELLSRGNATSLKPAELAGAIFAFVYEPDDPTRCVHDDPEIKRWYRNLTQSSEGKPRGQCLVTGEADAVLTRLHAKPKGVPPVSITKGGVPLTTVNQESFVSYGLDRLGGAPISERANVAIENALARLLADAYPGPDGAPLPSRRVSISKDSVLVYWAPASASVDFFAAIDAQDPENVAQMMRSATGANPAPIDDPSRFYALILSGKQGRAIVRTFVETTVRDLARDIDQFRGEVRIVRPYEPDPGGFCLRDIRSALVPRGDHDLLPPAFNVALFLAIVMGRPYPGAVLETVVRRNRSELFRSDPRGRPDPRPLAARCSLLKAWFKRNRGKEMPVSLDPTRTEIPYRLGRLLATLDKVQADALGDVNATIVDRYFGSASATPAAVLPTLIRRSQSHLSKLRREKPGLHVVRERLVQEILGSLDSFPRTLNLEDQGLFAIGFYHQRQDFFTSKREDH